MSGKPIGSKTCNVCLEEKPLAEFSFVKARQRYMNYCKTCNNAKYKKYRKRDHYKEYHKECQRTDNYKKMLRECRQADPGKRKHRADTRRYRKKLKDEVLSHYSAGQMKCAKCPYANTKALTIDHIDGKGNEHRRTIGGNGSINFYAWLRKNNYPEGLQVLCMNCQFEKRVDNNECGPK